jgi:hypothetical protein
MARNSITAGGRLLALIVTIAAIFPVQEICAGQAGTFTGTWIASGRQQSFDFVQGRQVGTFKLAGTVSLEDGIHGIDHFWAECVGLADSVSGGSTRCVWRSLTGSKAYCVFSGQPLKKGVRVTGQFVGGTGSLKGISGTLSFTWKSTFIDEDQDMFTGQTTDLTGKYRIP